MRPTIVTLTWARRAPACRNLGIDCSVLMGGNVAYEIAKKELSEAVVGTASRETGALFRKLFQTPYFNVDIVQDVVGGPFLQRARVRQHVRGGGLPCPASTV